MKRTNKKRTLTLSAQTLRPLAAGALTQAAGGFLTGTCFRSICAGPTLTCATQQANSCVYLCAPLPSALCG